MPARGNVYIEAIPEPALVAQVYFAAADKLKNMEEPLNYASGVANDEIKSNFSSQGRPSGWAPLSEATLARRAWSTMSRGAQTQFVEAQKGSGVTASTASVLSSFSSMLAAMAGTVQILVDTGTLEQSATGGDNWQFRRLSGNEQSVELADPTGYGHFHITGTSKPMPIRDWSYISDDGIDRMAAFMAEWVAS